MATLIKADGTVVDLGDAPLSAARLHELVGGHFEVVTLRTTNTVRGHGRDVLVVNDDGHRLNLPINRTATALYRGNPPRHADVIMGDAVRALVTNGGQDNERWS